MAAAVRAAPALLAAAALLAASALAQPCCPVVMPYHIQALALRMAQRFQALEMRAQDLRGVFASFQAVHAHVSNRLRFLEAEHAHLSETVDRLGSRLQALEQEVKMNQRLEYYRRGRRHAGSIRATLEQLIMPPRRRPFFTRRRRAEEATELPPLIVDFDQPKDPSEILKSNSQSGASIFLSGGINHPPLSSETPTSSIQKKLHLEPEIATSETTNVGRYSTPLSRVLTTEAVPEMIQDAPAGDSATTPTPLWQLEETASAQLDVMSAGDGDVGVDVLNEGMDVADDAVSYWSPANETDSLEQLFGSTVHKSSECTGQETTDCRTDGQSTHVSTAKSTGVESVTLNPFQPIIVTNSSSRFNNTVLFVPHVSNGSQNSSDLSDSSVKFSNQSVNTIKCKSSVNRVPPVGDSPFSSDGMGNLTNVFLGMENTTAILLDKFLMGAGTGGGGASAGNSSGSVGNGSVGESGDAAAGSELSDVELQAALRELETLLQRPASAAQSPDPEKVLLKRALSLALAALERTSDACLKLVNFTADAFEGLTVAGDECL